MKKINYVCNFKDSEIFNSSRIYINQIYYKYDGDIIDLDIEEKRNSSYEDTTGWIFTKCKCCYIDKKSAFDSIMDLGKKLATKPEDLNETQIINSIAKNSSLDEILNYITWRGSYKDKITYRDYFTKVVEDFIEDNFYPYATFNKQYLIFDFCKDCMTFYSLYQIHIWIIKILNNIDKIIESNSKSQELEGLIKSLNFIDFENIIHSLNLNNYIFNLPDDYSPVEDYRFYTSFKYQNASKEDILRFCEIIRRVLIGYIMDMIQQDTDNYLITKQKVFYDPENKEYGNMETANSLMGIICNEILSCIIAKKLAFGKVPCENPNCTNNIIKKGRTKYCQNPECQTYRKAKKSKKYYDNKKKKVSK